MVARYFLVETNNVYVATDYYMIMLETLTFTWPGDLILLVSKLKQGKLLVGCIFKFISFHCQVGISL